MRYFKTSASLVYNVVAIAANSLIKVYLLKNLTNKVFLDLLWEQPKDNKRLMMWKNGFWICNRKLFIGQKIIFCEETADLVEPVLRFREGLFVWKNPVDQDKSIPADPVEGQSHIWFALCRHQLLLLATTRWPLFLLELADIVFHFGQGHCRYSSVTTFIRS